MADVVRFPSPTSRTYIREVNELEERLGSVDAVLRLFDRVQPSLGSLGIEVRSGHGLWMCLRGAQILADEPALTTAQLSEELGELWREWQGGAQS